MAVKWLVFVAGIALALAAAGMAAGITIGRGGGDAGSGGDMETVRVPAPIDEVEIRVLESFPPQYVLYVVSGLPSGCAKFDEYEVERDGDTIHVKVWNLMPADDDVACTMIYGTVEHNINLGSDFESGKTYTVHVNDVTKTFTAQ